MKSKILILISVIGSMFFTSCTSVYRATYSIENIKGSATINEENMLADYGRFKVQYSTRGDVTIINNTDSTMFIDMAESYYVGNGVAQQLYTNSVTTSYSSGTKGTTVNLGSITNAIGIGGVVGTIAQGVNVGGSNTNGEATQIFEERYISIPAFSRKPIKSVSFRDEEMSLAKGIKKGGDYKYDKYNSFNNEYIFAYTFDPKASTWQSTRDLIYINEINKANHISLLRAYKFSKTNHNNETSGDVMNGIDVLYIFLITWGGVGALYSPLLFL